MHLETFNKLLSRIDPTLFCKRGRPPKRAHEVGLRETQREERFMLFQKVPSTGKEEFVRSIETDEGGFREPLDCDLQWAREMQDMMAKLWSNPNNSFMLENWCVQNVDAEHLSRQEKLSAYWREIYRGPMWEEMRCIYQRQYKALFGGKRVFHMGTHGRHNVQNWGR